MTQARIELLRRLNHYPVAAVRDAASERVDGASGVIGLTKGWSDENLRGGADAGPPRRFLRPVKGVERWIDKGGGPNAEETIDRGSIDMGEDATIAVLGLYNSGSTAVAGVLRRLGVDMGAPFWFDSDDRSPRNYYEPRDLSMRLRSWWNEPEVREIVDRAFRVAYLAEWRRRRAPGPVGAKHPLLCLCGGEIVEAWGGRTRFVRVWRPLDESIERLRARRWFPGREDALQQTLWAALDAFCERRPRLLVVDYHRLRREPEAVVAEIAAYARLSPTPARLDAAAAFIDRG